MADPVQVSDEQGALQELGPIAEKAEWRERHNCLPFHLLSDDAFEICCFILLLREHPGEKIYYYGKTGDRGRDIVRRHPDGTVEFVQCKRYGSTLGVGEVREELAKLCVNVFLQRLPEVPDRVTFYVVPDLSSDAQDLLSSQEKWKAAAAKALEDHLREKASPQLLQFAQAWWPKPDRVTEVALAERARQQPDLIERFFAVRKVIDGSVTQLLPLLRDIREEIRTLPAGIVNVLLPHLRRAQEPAATQPVTKAQEAVSRSQAKTWEERARRSLDAQGEKLWEDIRRDIRGLNSIRALDAGSHLREWLAGEGRHASSAIRGRACILLADLAVIEAAVRSLQEQIDVTEARSWQARALDEFGDTPSPEDSIRLVYLDARLTWLDGRPADALAALDFIDDPSCASLRLSILISQGKDEEAVAVARALPFDDRWCDRIVLAYARAGLPGEAAAVYPWAQTRPEPSVFHRCVIAWTQGTLQRLFKARDRRSLFLEPPSEDDARTLRELLDNLEPIFAPATARGRPAHGVETEALELAFVVARFLGQHGEWWRIAALLARVTPVSQEYARAVCRGDVEDAGDLAGRLRADYPHSFLAGHLAAIIDAQRGASFAQTLAAVEALMPLAVDADRREQLAELLFERANHQDGVEVIEQARSVGTRLLDEGHPLLRATAYEILRHSGKTQEADALLAASQDEADPVWLQLAASHEYLTGSRVAALRHMVKAAHLLGRRETYWHAFSVANELGDTQVMRELMQALARRTPDDVKVHRNIAAIEFKAGRFREAEQALREVERLAPGMAETGLFLAQALALSGREEEAVHFLNRVCGAHPTAFPPYHLRAVLLDALGKAPLAFEGLHAARDQFWNEMPFVCLYHTIAYKANREKEARLAFLRMQELQGSNPDGPLQSATLDELREMMRAERERHEHLNEQLLQGRLPWVLVSHALRRESYIDWAIRTQQTITPDAHIARAEYAVYATNGFAVQEQQGGRRSLVVPLSESPPGQPVVADLSALITLHRLGLLERCLAHFGRILLPAGYVRRFLEELRSLQPHQASEVEARRVILAAVDQGRLRTAPPADPARPNALPVLDEYHREDEPADFHLADAVEWLQRAGRLNAEEAARIRMTCHRPASGGAFQAAAPRGLCGRVSTLITVQKCGLLDHFLGAVKLLLDQGEIEELRQELLGVERRSEVIRWNRELHALLTGDPRVETAEPDRPAGREDAEDLDPVLDAFLLADQRQLPLLIDDRCLQTMLLNARQGRAGAAFGTNHVLTALAEAQRLDVAEWATAWLQLARWRYRFHVPSPEVLLELAGRHADFPPGQELRDVCRYVHDCCADPGLFCGLEPTTPPTAIGLRYFQTVIQAIGRFLMRAWHDARFDDRAVTALTHWCASEFLPPPPRSMPYAAFSVACASIPQLLLLTVQRYAGRDVLEG
jgi:tetratricopeptide (TPR) repeat protein